MSEPLAILLLSGQHDRAHYAFMLATSAAALGRTVTLFATNAGCHALLADWSGLAGADRDNVLLHRGVAGLDILREAAIELGIQLLVCEAGLRAEDLTNAALAPGVQIAGLATFLAQAGAGQILAI